MKHHEATRLLIEVCDQLLDRQLEQRNPIFFMFAQKRVEFQKERYSNLLERSIPPPFNKRPLRAIRRGLVEVKEDILALRADYRALESRMERALKNADMNIRSNILWQQYVKHFYETGLEALKMGNDELFDALLDQFDTATDQLDDIRLKEAAYQQGLMLELIKLVYEIDALGGFEEDGTRAKDHLIQIKKDVKARNLRSNPARDISLLKKHLDALHFKHFSKTMETQISDRRRKAVIAMED